MMKKTLRLFLLLALIFAVSCCGCSNAASVVSPIDTNHSTEGNLPTTEAPTQKPTEAPTQKPTECQHNYSAATCTKVATCTKCGATTGSKAEHNYSAATCTKVATCTECGATTGSKAEHNYSAATCTKAATCTGCGATTGKALGHSFQAATCSSPQKCTKCGITNGTATAHKFGSNGLCTICNKKITAKDLENTIKCKLIVPRNGTNNYYATVEVGNASGSEMQISPYISINGYVCNTLLGFSYLPTGYQRKITAYRATRADLIYEDKYCDMYLDNNSECHFVATMYGVSFVIYGDVNGNTRIELN